MAALDWIVIVAYAAGMLVIGWLCGRRAQSTDDYLLGGRRMAFWAVGVSMFAASLSVISYLSVPGEVIRYGPVLYCGTIEYPIAILCVNRLLVPALMKIRITSAYELLEIRLGVRIRVVVSLMFLLAKLLWMALIVFMCAQKVVVPVLGCPAWAAIWVSIGIFGVTLLYTSLGGLRAVVVTDVVQALILFGAALLSILLIGYRLGNVMAWLPREWPTDWVRWTWCDVNARVSFLPVVLAYFFAHLCAFGSDQMTIQRYLATGQTQSARKALWTAMLFDLLTIGILVVLGLSLRAYFTAFPSVLPGHQTLVGAADSLFPLFIVECLPVGVTGLVVAGLLASVMSGLSAGVNSSCVVVSQDLLTRFRSVPFSEAGQVRAARIISLLIGIAIVLVSLLMNKVRGNLVEVSYKTGGLLAGPIFVPFFMALFVRRAKEGAALVATLTCLLCSIGIAYSTELITVCTQLFGSAPTAAENCVVGPGLSFLWIQPICVVVGVATGILLSWLPIPEPGSQQSSSN